MPRARKVWAMSPQSAATSPAGRTRTAAPPVASIMPDSAPMSAGRNGLSPGVSTSTRPWSPFTDEMAERIAVRRRMDLQAERAGQRLELLQAAGALQVGGHDADPGAGENGARCQLGDRGGLAGTWRPDQEEGCRSRRRQRREAEQTMQSLSQRGFRLAVRGGSERLPQAAEKIALEAVMVGKRLEPGQVGGAHRRDEKIREIEILVLDRGGDPDRPALQILARDDDRILAEDRPNLGEGAGGVRRGDALETHRSRHTWPSVRIRALAWISFCERTTVAGRKRSMIERT